jgi:thiamine-monophosphate kinase
VFRAQKILPKLLSLDGVVLLTLTRNCVGAHASSAPGSHHWPTNQTAITSPVKDLVTGILLATGELKLETELLPLPERKLIQRIARQAMQLGARSPLLLAGIGDDCAVLRPPAGHDLLVTTDFTLEGVHFRRDWHPAAVVGHRCLTRGLSDLAAMGGEPMAAFLSLALPAGLPQRWADQFVSGLLKLAQQFRVPLAGGDVAQSPASGSDAEKGAGVLADIVLLGHLPAGQAILRSGARPGEVIYVTGTLGRGAASLRELSRTRRARTFPHRWLCPTPRLAVGKALRTRRLPTAMIDLSDGLSTDLDHICESSRVGAELYADCIPRARWRGVEVELELALNGGEDYELLFTAPAGVQVPRKIAGVPVTRVGRIIPGRKMYLIRDGKRTPLRPAGWEHFR